MKFIKMIKSFEVRMNKNGEFYFVDSKNRLYFAMAEKFFYFYNYEEDESYLKLLFLLAPKIPFITKAVEFEEYLPLNIKFKGVKLYLIIVSFTNIHKKSIYKKDILSIKGKFREIKFSSYEKGFDTIVYLLVVFSLDIKKLIMNHITMKKMEITI